MHGLKVAFTGLPRQYNNLREEILDVTDIVLRSGNLMNSYYTAEFEYWLAQKNQVKYAITCHSGTQALEIIASYYRDVLGGGHPRVLIPAMTYPATANAFATSGWNIDIGDTDRYGILDTSKITRHSEYQAICMVGLYGAAVDYNIEHQLIIEDGAQHWLSGNCHRSGPTAISFDPTKNLPNYGNGGAIVTDNRALADYAKSWCNNGKTFKHADFGSNSRMSEIDCAQMLVKKRYIDAWQLQRSKIAKYWMARLEKSSSIRCLIDNDNFHSHSFHKFVIDIDNRDLVQKKLLELGIETKIHYQNPLHELAAYEDLPGPGLLSVASSMARRCLTLPLYPELTDLEIDYIIDSVLNCV